MASPVKNKFYEEDLDRCQQCPRVLKTHNRLWCDEHTPDTEPKQQGLFDD